MNKDTPQGMTNKSSQDSWRFEVGPRDLPTQYIDFVAHRLHGVDV